MSILKISEAASLAIHAMVLLAKEPERKIQAHEIAETLAASEHHLAKVMQRLAKSELVEGERGPSGGFLLRKSAKKITLLDIYQAIDGPLPKSHCLLGLTGNDCQCLMGGLLDELHRLVHEHFSRTTLQAAADNFNLKGSADVSKKNS